MYSLLQRHFLGVEREIFEADLADKDYAILLTDGKGELKGFTTFALAPDAGLWVIYSGDTIVDRSGRSSFALSSTWIGSIRRLKKELGIRDLVWLLICSGPRTYRFLPVFFRDFYPRRGQEAPAAIRRRMDRLATARYGPAYDPKTGIVRLAHPQPLRPELLASPEMIGDEDVRFFLQRNPGHDRGDELACYTEIEDDNLTAAGRRMVRSGKVGGPPAEAPR